MSADDNFAACLAFTLGEEGGYQDNTKDRGNYYGGAIIGTNRGISAPVLAEWLGRPPSIQEMRDLTEAEAAPIYAARFWNVVRGAELPAGLDLLVFDHAVNAGPAASVRLLQTLLGSRLGAVTVDGFMGPRTVAAVQRLASSVMLPALALAQTEHYRKMPRFPDFGAGWLKRVGRRERAAARMARGEP